MTDTTPQTPAPPAPTYLPALFADAAGALDLDSLRTLAGSLKPALIDGLRRSATDLRAARGTVVTEEDTYDLTRRLVDAGEVLRRLADVFTAAAREADAIIEEEAVTVHGEDDGVPRASLFVPDGVGQRIAVRTDWGTGPDSWDLASLVGWLAEDQTDDAAVNIEEDGGWSIEIVAGVARDAMNRLLALGRFAPSVKAVEGLRLRAAEQEDDATAALLRQLRTKGERIYKGVKITREPMPKSQR